MLRQVDYHLPSWHIGFENGISKGKSEERKTAINILYGMGIDIATIFQKFEISENEVKELLKG